jgi:hypothetical protein
MLDAPDREKAITIQPFFNETFRQKRHRTP